MTAIRDQAERMAKRKRDAFGGKAVVQEYEFDESCLTKDDLKVLVFEGTTPDWATFIFKNRSKKENCHHDYDIVLGPIADDGVAFLINQYTSGAVTLAQFTRMLKFKKLNNQYFFGTDKAVNLLRRIK